MNKLLDELKKHKYMVADGAWGTMLLASGMEVGGCPEIWNAEYPEKVLSVANAYIAAGSRLIKTNTFGGNPIKLRDYELEDEAFNLNKLGAEISKKAAGDNVYVLGSLGPTGKFLFTGDISENDLYEAYKLQASALISGGVDALLFETFYALDEAEIAIKSAKDNFNIPIFSTFTFDKNEDGNFRTMMGVDIETYVNSIIKLGVDIIGTNCGNGFNDMISVVKSIRSYNHEIPILVNSNAGMPEIVEGKLIFPETPEFIEKIVPKLIEAWANIIGGCCGTTPEHIKVINNIILKLISENAN